MKVAFTTLGCRTNQHDTAEMQTLLELEGVCIVDAGEEADVYVVNSCTVTQKSDSHSRRAVKKALGINKNARVVFTGCYAQTNPEEAAKILGVNLLLGNANKLEIPAVVRRVMADKPPRRQKSGTPEIRMSDISRKRAFTTIPVSNFQGKTKAFIKVQTGCDERCSFCPVFKARGKSLSDSRENILNNVQSAVDAGYREITLTGINLGTYGMGLRPARSFSSLVADILELKGRFRVRLSSINPMEIDDRLIQLIADHENLCPHLHVPLQSGDDTILARMRRNYNSRQYVDVIRRVLDKIPEPGLGADVIVGFPGETDAMFERTFELVESLPFSYLHIFSYSPRKGTEAGSFKNTVLKKVKKARHKALTELRKKKELEFRRRFLGRTVSVLVENQPAPVSGSFKGHSERFIPVFVADGASFANQIVPVVIKEVSERQVSGCVQS